MSAGGGDRERSGSLFATVGQVVGWVTAAIAFPAGLWLLALGFRNDWDLDIIGADAAYMAAIVGGVVLVEGTLAVLIALRLRSGVAVLPSIGMFVIAGIGFLASAPMGETLRTGQLLIVLVWLTLGVATFAAARHRASERGCQRAVAAGCDGQG